MVGSITLILIVFTQTTAVLKVKLKIMGALRPKIKLEVAVLCFGLLITSDFSLLILCACLHVTEELAI